jgi:hypothetical protein
MKWLRRYWPYVVFILLLCVNGLALWRHQWIGDWLRLRNYQPPAEIAALVDGASMTSRSQHLFYINHPLLEGKQGFNQHCADKDQETAVLGCYHGDRQGIYLYAVDDVRLQGVREVTAAHEMLHQAYDRLNTVERQRIDKLLNEYYSHGLQQANIQQKIANYTKQKDVVLTSEMHSIFGSEVRKLPPELEQYYARYFKDRLKVVTLSEAYQAEFDRRERLVTEYDTQLGSLKAQIDGNKASLDRRLSELTRKEREVNDAFAKQDATQYRAAIVAYNSQVEAYNAKVNATRSLIQQYNTVVIQRNEIAVEEQQLQKALDSTVAPEPK